MNVTEYSEGRLADVFGEQSQPVVLLWHGMQADARASVRTLAQRLARHGIAVVAPDWNSHAPDAGRAALLESVEFARRFADDPDGIVLVGWSMGGVAAAALTVNSASFDVSFAHTVCLAGAFSVRAPTSGRLVGDDVEALPRTARSPAPFTLLHGASDDVVPVSVSAAFADTLRAADWPVEFEELDADHGSIAGAVYDPDLDQYLAAHDQPTLRVADDVAARIADLAKR